MDNSTKKAVFQLKLDGTFDAIIRHAFMHGYVGGHKFGKHFGNLLPSDIEKAFVEYKEVIENDMKGQKPT